MIPNSEFYVSRTAFKDNTSHYMINDKRVHSKEIDKVFKQHNVDLDHNRFVILQNEVESIALKKAKGMTDNECGLLEYLDDIIGTTRYKEPLQKINNRLEILTEEDTNRHNRCKMVEQQMNELEAPKEQAVDYIDMENERTRTQNLFLQKMVFDKSALLNDLEPKQLNIIVELKELDEKFAEITKNRLEQEKLIERQKEQNDQLLKTKEEYEQNVTATLSKYESQSQKIKSDNKQLKRIQNDIKKETETLVELKKIPSKNADEIQGAKNKIEKLSAERKELQEKLEKNLDSLQTIQQPSIEERNELENQLMIYQAAVNKYKAAVSVSSNELELCQHSEVSEKEKYNICKQSLEDSHAELAEKLKELQTIESELPEKKHTLAEYQQQLQKNEKMENELTLQLRKLRVEIQEQQSIMKAMRSNNRTLDALMQQKIKGKIPGILGRLVC